MDDVESRNPGGDVTRRAHEVFNVDPASSEAFQARLGEARRIMQLGYEATVMWLLEADEETAKLIRDLQEEVDAQRIRPSEWSDHITVHEIDELEADLREQISERSADQPEDPDQA